MAYYVQESSGVFVHCFEITGVEENDLLNDFIAMDEIINEYRKTLTAKDLWTRMALTVDADGTFNVDYEYEQDEDSNEDWR